MIPPRNMKKLTGSTFLQDQASTAHTVDTTRNYTKQGVKETAGPKFLDTNLVKIRKPQLFMI